MQIEIQEGSELLAEMMKDDPDYKKFLAISEELEQEPELAKRVHAFRKKNYALQNSCADPEQEMWEMNQEYQSLIRIPLVSEYFDAEASVCKMLQDIVDYIHKEIRFPEL